MNKTYFLVLVNIISFILMGYDKYSAIKKQSRISETALLTISLLGGSIGTLFGMIIFHHKTKKLKFIILVPLFLIITLLVLLFQ